MKFSWKRLAGRHGALALALACANCGGGTTGSTLSARRKRLRQRRERLGRQWRFGRSGRRFRLGRQPKRLQRDEHRTGRQPQRLPSLWQRQSLEPGYFRLRRWIPNSSAIINFIGPTVGMHADFGSGQYQGSNIGIPYSVVGGTQTPVTSTSQPTATKAIPGRCRYRQRADRRRPESGQRRSPRAGAR